MLAIIEPIGWLDHPEIQWEPSDFRARDTKSEIDIFVPAVAVDQIVYVGVPASWLIVWHQLRQLHDQPLG